MKIDGKEIFQIGIPIHQATAASPKMKGERADAGQPAIADVYDPNAYTPEFKGFLVKIEKA